MPNLIINNSVLIPIDKIQANSWNPNHMDETTYQATKQSIIDDGFVGSIYVRPADGSGNHVIIDGEHRWRAAKELGYTEIPCIILDKSEAEAMLATLKYGRLRGEFDVVELATVLKQLENTYTADDLHEKLGYTKYEMEGMRRLLDAYEATVPQNLPQDLPDGEPLTKEKRFSVHLSTRQWGVLEQAFDLAGKDTEADALVEVCLFFLMNHDKKQ